MPLLLVGEGHVRPHVGRRPPPQLRGPCARRVVAVVVSVPLKVDCRDGRSVEHLRPALPRNGRRRRRVRRERGLHIREFRCAVGAAAAGRGPCGVRGHGLGWGLRHPRLRAGGVRGGEALSPRAGRVALQRREGKRRGARRLPDRVWPHAAVRLVRRGAAGRGAADIALASGNHWKFLRNCRGDHLQVALRPRVLARRWHLTQPRRDGLQHVGDGGAVLAVKGRGLEHAAGDALAHQFLQAVVTLHHR
mmetsp:Transcript_49054/g.151481  ORF Transcript_49054/g.151481 Transcript_49054/m.151481 type:complete len:248 (-) Transcript_49054:129-872(-)